MLIIASTKDKMEDCFAKKSEDKKKINLCKHLSSSVDLI